MSRVFLNALLGAALAAAGHAALAQGQATQTAAAEQKPAANETERFPSNHALCIGCHGIPGYHTAFPSVYHVPMIAGQKPDYIVNALKEYKAGQRSHPSMRAIASTLTEDDMKALADYYGGSKP